MNTFDNYKENLEVDDRYGVDNIPISSTLVCSQYDLIDPSKLPPKRHEPPLAAAVVGLDNTEASRFPFCHKHKAYEHYYWSDIDAQQKILEAKPTCYLILGKQGCGSYTLGEELAKTLNCIHLCPQNILVDEIESKSPTGKCLDFNLRHNGICHANIIMKMIKQIVKSPAVQHRGYVISGIPLVTSYRGPKYFLAGIICGEQAILVVEEIMQECILNATKKRSQKETKKETEDDDDEDEAEEEQPAEGEEEKEDPPIELPKHFLEPCEDVIFTKKARYATTQSVLLNQMTEIFKLDMSPDVVIFITSPDGDIVTKRSHKYYDYKKKLYVEQPFAKSTKNEIRWPQKYSMSEENVFVNSTVVLNPKYHCKQPMDFRERAEEQICNYKTVILPFIEKKLQDFDQRDVIELDGHWPVSQMLHNIFERKPFMRYLNPVVVPQPLYLPDPPDEIEEFWTNVDEMVITTNGIVKFNRHVSPWYSRCPVELKHRQAVRGKPKYAISFFKHVFLMSSLDAVNNFWKNPRPFLKLHYLEPTCRVIVMGTKSSGKTMIAECLSWIFKATIIDFNEIKETEKIKKYEPFIKSIFDDLVATIDEKRFLKWQNNESERVKELEKWKETTLKNLKKYIDLLANQNANRKALKVVKANLSFLPYLLDVSACKRALKDQVSVLQYAPQSLITVTEQPKYPLIDDTDVTEAISTYIETNNLQNAFEPTGEELMTVVSKLIFEIDSTAKNATDSEELYGKYIIDNFTTDPDCWEYLIDNKMMPDHTIAIIENREITPELIDYYMKLEKSPKDYSERFLLAEDPLIRIRLQDNEISPSFKENIKQSQLNQSTGSAVTERDEAANQEEMMTEFSTAIDRFREDWDSLKSKIEDSYKSFIEVEIDEKNDVLITEEVLLKLRRSYCPPCEPTENNDMDNKDEGAEPRPKDWITHCDPLFYCETGIYCPVAFYDYGVLWEGKPELFIKYDNKAHYFCKEECIDIFKRDVTKYQSYALPFKKLPPYRICVIGCIGSGKTTISKIIAKEFGLMYVDFAEAINNFLIPRHFKKVGRSYENSFTDSPIDDEEVVEFLMDEENEDMDILSNEAELRRMIFNYFERGAPILPILLERLLKKLWFEDPFVRTGLVIDGFPRLPSDVDEMLACFAIPDIIVQLESSSEAAIERLGPGMMKVWKSQQNEAKAKSKAKFNAVKEEWTHLITKTIVSKLIFEDIVDSVIISTEPAAVVLSNDSPVTDSPIIDAEPVESFTDDPNNVLLNIYNEMIEEYPEPIDESEWEDAKDARERIDARIEAIYGSDDENIGTLRETLLEQKIRFVTVDVKRSLTKVERVVLSKLSILKSRNASFFEQTFIVPEEIANKLLSEGMYFYSKFYYMCPVYIFENPKTIMNPYRLGKRKGDLYHVCHRSYIYYVIGKDAVCKFRRDPLKYVTSDNILEYRGFPMRIGIIGPPKSGKSTLTAKLEMHYGLMPISIGMVVRNILNNMHWTELGIKMRKSLEEGKRLDHDLLVLALQAATVDWRIITHGFVFDGFPDSASLATGLSRVGLYPLVIFDLTADKKVLIDRSQNEVYYNIIKQIPPYSNSYVNRRYSVWNYYKNGLRNLINNDCQNIVPISGNGSKWQCFQNAIDNIKALTPKIHHYLMHSKKMAVCVDIMCISNKMFEERMSHFKDLCPLCLRQRILKHNRFPVDKKGVIQFENVFYWVCSDHMSVVLKDPSRHLPGPIIEIPEIPVVVKNVLVHLVYENGICIVSYAENLPSQKVVTGDKNYAASYSGKTYMFCSAICLQKFMMKPHLYYDIKVFKQTQMLQDVNLNKLPNIGYLEQTLGNLLTKACCAVNVLRPKYPGLSIELSGLLYIGLYLKVNNPRLNDNYLPLYKRILKHYEQVSKVIIKTGLVLRSMDNPFANYPICCTELSTSDSRTVCKPSTASSFSVQSDLQMGLKFGD